MTSEEYQKLFDYCLMLRNERKNVHVTNGERHVAPEDDVEIQAAHFFETPAGQPERTIRSGRITSSRVVRKVEFVNGKAVVVEGEGMTKESNNETAEPLNDTDPIDAAGEIIAIEPTPSTSNGQTVPTATMRLSDPIPASVPILAAIRGPSIREPSRPSSSDFRTPATPSGNRQNARKSSGSWTIPLKQLATLKRKRTPSLESNNHMSPSLRSSVSNGSPSSNGFSSGNESLSSPCQSNPVIDKFEVTCSIQNSVMIWKPDWRNDEAELRRRVQVVRQALDSGVEKPASAGGKMWCNPMIESKIKKLVVFGDAEMDETIRQIILHPICKSSAQSLARNLCRVFTAKDEHKVIAPNWIKAKYRMAVLLLYGYTMYNCRDYQSCCAIRDVSARVSAVMCVNTVWF